MSDYKYNTLEIDSFNAYIIFNTTDNDIDFSVKEIGYCKAVPGYRKIFTSDDYILHYVLSGKGKFAGETVSSGNGFLIKPSSLIVHQAAQDEYFEHCWIILSGYKVKELLHSCNMSLDNHVFSNDRAHDIAKMLKDAVFYDYENQNIEFSLKSLIYKILSFHKPQSDISSDSDIQNSKYITHATTFISENYTKPIKISDIAKSVNLSQNHLCKLFNKVLHCSIKNYLIEYRIGIAKNLLKKTNLSITEIANSVGFDDSMYFSQVFRKHTGQTPTDFRELKGVKNTHRRDIL